MGKKSRRKKVNKKERKEQLEERRERLNEIVDGEDDEDDQEHDDAHEEDEQKEDVPIELGERVFYQADDGSDMRGILKDISAEGRYLILPIEKADDPEAYVDLPESRVIRDCTEWTARFKVGDKILSNPFGESWLPGSVTRLFPVDFVDGSVSAYLCTDTFTSASQHTIDGWNSDAPFTLPVDHDDYIQKHPQSFRFSVGDEVVFASSLAVGLSSRRHETWIRGKIARVDIVGRSDYYAVYECSYMDQKRRRNCHILKDDDEHIASLNASPRERLFESIEQDCGYEHIDDLIKSSGLDVLSFRDLFLSKAIENASYGALLWLQEAAEEDLSRICDEEGNRLLHQIAKSSHAEIFFAAAAEKEWKKRDSEVEPTIDLDRREIFDDDKSSLFRARNKHGRTFLHELIVSGNKRAIDIVLSPSMALAWKIALCYMFCEVSEPLSNIHVMTRDKNGLNLKDTAHLLGQFEMEKMVDEFSEWHLLYELATKLDSLYAGFRGDAEDVLKEAISKFGAGGSRLSIAKRLISFRKRWGHRAPSSGSVEFDVVKLSRGGQYDALSWLLEADSSLQTVTDHLWAGPPNPGEFTQSCKKLEGGNDEKELDLVGFASVGDYFGRGGYDDDVRNEYISILRRYDIREGISLVGHMKREIERSVGYKLKSMLEDRVSLLEDDKSLQGRLKILDYLVKEKGMSPPNALSVIEWRQCGILRWLLEDAFIKMDESACESTSIMREGKILAFLGSEDIPRNMTVGVFLCFAAIEFDDLQSFEWLVKNQGIPLSSIVCNGLNALHCCASLGRAEIVLWLLQSQSQPTLTSLLEEKCSRRPWHGYYAAHIAVEGGFTFLSDTLLSSGCPKETDSGKTVIDLAKKSRLEPVREWGAKMEKPMQLEVDIQRLLYILSKEESSVDDIKHHIVDSACMDYKRWADCNYYVNEPGPLGKSFVEILELCFRLDNPEYSVWLCQELSPRPRPRPQYRSDRIYAADDWHSFWLYPIWQNRTFIGLPDLKDFATKKGDDLLRRCLSKAWAKQVRCREVLKVNHVLRTMLLSCDKVDSSASRTVKSLRDVADDLLRAEVFSQLQDAALDEIKRLFLQGADPTKIAEIVEETVEIAAALASCEGLKISDYFSDYDVISAQGNINLDGLVFTEYGEMHPIKGMVEWSTLRSSRSSLFLMLAVEGHTELIKWILQDRERNDFDESKQSLIVRIAAYLGHTDIVELFLGCRAGIEIEIAQAALLGAAEAGRLDDLIMYFGCLKGAGLPPDPIIQEFEKIPMDHGQNSPDLRHTAVASSLTGTVLFACLEGIVSDGSSLVSRNNVREDHLLVLKWMLSEALTNIRYILQAASLVLRDGYEMYLYERCADLLDFLGTEYGSSLIQYSKDVERINEFFSLHVLTPLGNKDADAVAAVTKRWLSVNVRLGFDIQNLEIKTYGREDRHNNVIGMLANFQNEQLLMWSQFDPIKENGSLEDIKDLVESENMDLKVRSRFGFLATHLAAAYDRVDVLMWLVQDKGMSLDEFDGHGRDVLQVAKDSGARSVAEWIVLNTAGNVIAIFVSSHYRRRCALREKITLLRSVEKIQAWQRGNNVRRSYRGRLLSRLDEIHRFQEIWGGSVAIVAARSSLDSDCTWQAIKQREHDIVRIEDFVEDEDILMDTAQKLEEAATRVLAAGSSVNVERESESPTGPTRHDIDKNHEKGGGNAQAVEPTPDLRETNHRDFAQIRMTQDVMKWLRRSDQKYRDFFIRRITQLAAGDRSRILAKRLTGSQTLIYETYLEQQSGHRILWTENEGGSLLIWYVAKHKSVSRLMTLIDDAENRSSRQLTAASSLPEISSGIDSPLAGDDTDGDLIMLDPLGDTPLKLFEVNSDEIERLRDPTWKPRLFLTTREREVVETCGTVLLLGRSGTGKTCVIGNRMDYDRQRAGNDSRFSQLFVARSKGLCDYVKGVVDGGDGAEMKFETFNEIVFSLEENLPSLGDGKNVMFLPSSKMDFQRFKKDFYRSDESSDTVDALIVWTNIRSFIKGSIEALQRSDKVLSEEEYLNLGKKRCRLSLEQRKFVYSTFQRYKAYLKELGLWDDCDRITALVQRLDHARTTDLLEYQEVRYNKIYVDEVQDYTQAEIALFFYLCGPGDLFLAGDPAQSVVEGAEFRFEEIRSVGYHLYGDDRRHLIPEKPKTVHVNFRSHCGILNVAAAILSCLFKAFPDSAKQLKEDRGLFQGPRPGVFHKVEVPRLADLISKRSGIVVLTHDRNVSKWSRALGNYPLVYGIREAKGLEFQEVILVDFFRDLPASLQKLWRDLLLGRDVTDIACRPEIEGHLKLLYTAVTRCIQRLHFAETDSSVAGDAFVRWLTTTTTTRSTETENSKEALAVKSSVESVEKMARTPDEWRSAGLDNAVMAESAEELLEKQTWIDRALYCFEQVDDSELASRARAHRLCIQFQLTYDNNETNEKDSTESELQAALLTEQLLRERLFMEAREVCSAILPTLGERAQETLQDRLVSQLPSGYTD